MTHSLLTQEGGDHYKNMRIQPVEFCSVNRYDPAAFSVLKYLSRHRVKNGLEDVKKGRHFVQIRRDLRRYHPSLFAVTGLDVIPIADYLSANKITGHEASILSDLHFWVIGGTNLPDSAVADFLIQKFAFLIESEYTPKEEPKE